MGFIWTYESVAWLISPFSLFLLWPLFPIVVVPWVIYVGYSIWRYHVNQETISPEGKAVYITGCAHGFGYDAALALNEAGFYVIAGCRDSRSEGAQSLLNQCAAPDRLKVIQLDVTVDSEVALASKAILKACVEHDLELWAVYSNAGLATFGEVEWCPLELFEKSMETNFLGALRVIKSVIPLIRKSRGRIVVNTSAIARHPVPTRSTYCSSKAALNALVECLRWEMHKFGVKVCNIVPGNFVRATNVFAELDSKIDQVIENLDPSVVSDYGSLYLETFRKHWKSYQKTGMTVQDTSVVIDDIKHAVMSKYPRDRYREMDWKWVAWDNSMSNIPEKWKTWFYDWKQRSINRNFRKDIL